MMRFVIFLVVAALVEFAALAVGAGGIDRVGAFTVFADPLLIIALSALALAITSFLAGLVTGDYSWVDRLWSLAPIGFVWYYALTSLFAWQLVVAAVLVTIWGGRLTFNFARKGGYANEEDYRWGILRQRIPNPILWQGFNLGFISLYQIGLFVLFTLPARILWRHEWVQPDLIGLIGFIASCLLLVFFIVFETVADEQQWKFHQVKKRAGAGESVADSPLAADVKQGFLSSGLFRLSRHPAYFGELGVWWSLYFAASFWVGTPLNWGLIGPVLLTLLFVGSTIFTEGITKPKYPSYADYCRRTSPIIPWPSRAAK